MPPKCLPTYVLVNTTTIQLIKKPSLWSPSHLLGFWSLSSPAMGFSAAESPTGLLHRNRNSPSVKPRQSKLGGTGSLSAKSDAALAGKANQNWRMLPESMLLESISPRAELPGHRQEPRQQIRVSGLSSNGSKSRRLAGWVGIASVGVSQPYCRVGDCNA